MGSRGLTVWMPEPLFAGETVFVVGGGPSLRGFDFGRLRGRRAIAVNAAGYDVPWADVLFFGDETWCRANPDMIGRWRGLVITTSGYSARMWPGRVRCAAHSRGAGFVAGGPVRLGASSGQTAVALAVAMAAARIVLVGFDMRPVDGAVHYHEGRELYTADHAVRAAAAYEAVFLPGWEGWGKAIADAGCRVVNATPASALTEFPAAALDDILAG